ncbi:DUF924 family protein [Pulveribacter sp.]|uniref:DUF924 family protein n=1 Tax=Pulveribacter sp. TaxID=2678893 RepID=UPI0028AD1D0D|nr:DUF924 family protein [Pulveribacter sp.]
MTPQTVLQFWFDETPPRQRFARDDAFDASIRERFGELHASAVQGELWRWRATPEGRLAEIVVIDQFSRNLHRDSPLAFAHDAMALVLAQEAVSARADELLSPEQRSFLYMPFMHSESGRMQKESVRLFTALGRAENLDYAHRHADIIERFGRYPHRNAALGRPSTDEELQFLQQPGSSF